jgi:hypothetical protein
MEGSLVDYEDMLRTTAVMPKTPSQLNPFNSHSPEEESGPMIVFDADDTPMWRGSIEDSFEMKDKMSVGPFANNSPRAANLAF